MFARLISSVGQTLRSGFLKRRVGVGSRLVLMGALLLALAPAQVMDRIAVTVGNDAITESEVLEEIRLTAFLNGEKPDESPASRRQAAERLIEQDLIRREMANEHYPEAEAAQARQMLANFRQAHFASETEFRQALASCGLTEDGLQAHLLWQLTALRFTDVNFGPRPTEALRARLEQSAGTRAREEALKDAAAPAGQGQAERSTTDPAPRQSVDQQLDRWLKDARSRTRIRFHEEAFQQ